MRKKIIAGNWKMNKTPTEATALINELKVKNFKCCATPGEGCDTVVCVPAVCLPAANDALVGCNIKLGAQNVHFEQSGAYTGEVSCAMLTEVGVTYVIIGHSERRQYFGETDESVNKRSRAALAGGLIPIICVGESLEQRESGVTESIVGNQTKIALSGMSAEEVSHIVIAYEPIWAIGTGRTATSEQANEVCAFIRGTVAELYSQAAADAVRIQYGGSMNAGNAAELLAMSDIDGGLIGGASLKADDFAVIVNAAS